MRNGHRGDVYCLEIPHRWLRGSLRIVPPLLRWRRLAEKLLRLRHNAADRESILPVPLLREYVSKG